MWVWEKMVPKRELPKNIPLHTPRLNYGTSIYELEYHVGEMGLSLNLVNKAWAHKKNSSYRFS
jgi:hypothetical protein